jgi:hypothetical protein
MARITPSFDPLRKRPLVIQLLDASDEGGRSEAEANRRDCVSADAFLLIRALDEPERESTAFVVQSYDGVTGDLVGATALYRMWLSLAGHLARLTDVEGPEEERMVNTCASFLKSLKLQELLDEQAGGLSKDEQIEDLVKKALELRSKPVQMIWEEPAQATAASPREEFPRLDSHVTADFQHHVDAEVVDDHWSEGVVEVSAEAGKFDEGDLVALAKGVYEVVALRAYEGGTVLHLKYRQT